jgi:hypothetical protein
LKTEGQREGEGDTGIEEGRGGGTQAADGREGGGAQAADERDEPDRAARRLRELRESNTDGWVLPVRTYEKIGRNSPCFNIR